MKKQIIKCPCCGRQIELQISKSGNITALFLCNEGIELGLIHSIIPDLAEGGEKKKDERHK